MGEISVGGGERATSEESVESQGSTTCLPTCLRTQQKSDKSHFYSEQKAESSNSEMQSPDSNPMSSDTEGCAQKDKTKGCSAKDRNSDEYLFKSAPDDVHRPLLTIQDDR